jgi:replicative DNA helicase
VGTVIRFLRLITSTRFKTKRYRRDHILFNKGERADLITITEELRQTGLLDSGAGPATSPALRTPSRRARTSSTTRRSSSRPRSGAPFCRSRARSCRTRRRVGRQPRRLEDAQKHLFELTDANQSATFKTRRTSPRAIEAIERLNHTRDAFTGVRPASRNSTR